MSVKPLRNVSLCVLGERGGVTRGRRRHTSWCDESSEARGHLEPLLSPWQQNAFESESEADLFIVENKNECGRREAVKSAMASRRCSKVLLMVKTIEILHFQDNYRVTVKQTEDLNLMENMVRKMQLHQHGSFSSKQQSSGTWSFSSNQRNTTENRNINKHQMEADTKTKETTLRTFVWRSVFSDVDINKSEPVFYPETNRLPSELHWSYDVFPAAAATLHNDTTASGSYQVTENNIGEALFMTDWNWNNSIVQNYLSDESDLSEGEKQEVFLTYSKQLDLSLRPEVVENIEESCSEVECSMYSYPDFLPEPFNILDLPELASLKCEKLKEITGATPESSIGKLLSRLLQMEKMQYLTIQKEKLKASRAHLISATGLRSSSPKAFHKQKYSRQNELSSLQLAYEGQYHEENSSWYKHQQNSAKCLCQQFCHCKWASRTSSIRDLTTQPVTRANSACKPSRTLVHSNSHQLFLHRPASTLAFSQIPQTFVEVTKVKLPSNMGTSYSVALRSTAKYKGRKKKPNTNKSKASNKLQLQRQNSLAVLCSSKQDLTQPDKG
uniref:Protein FAM217A isoform X10 n=1 Tax=Geotrypetes seraphini TaxID=260995 RepID=A0A6P8PQX2_GEOSA|nr:protein FAM217A isoform X10 [Geotrypetes seraphini]